MRNRSLGKGMRCSLCCDQSQLALIGCSPVNVGTMSHSSQEGTSLAYPDRDTNAATSITPQAPQTNMAAPRGERSISLAWRENASGAVAIHILMIPTKA